jgi:hypothetical protein
MKFMAIGTWEPDDTRIPQLLDTEHTRSEQLSEEGLVEQLFLRADRKGGFLLVRADSAERARERLATLPFVQAGVMQLELVELTE